MKKTLLMVKDIHYLEDEYPELAERIAIEAHQKALDPHEALKVGTVVFPVRAGFSSLFGGFLRVVKHMPQDGSIIPWISIKGDKDKSISCVLTYETWYRDVVIVPDEVANGTADDRWEFHHKMEKIWGKSRLTPKGEHTAR